MGTQRPNLETGVNMDCPSPEEMNKNKDAIITLLRYTQRENIESLIEYLCDSDYFHAPASTKYHLNFPGGLAMHSISVYKTLRRLCSEFDIDIPEESIIITCLLHDVCKIGAYKPQGDSYTYNRNQPPGHGDLSVSRILNYIELTDQERLMIRWHMNHYDRAFERQENTISKQCPEIYIMYFADHISTAYLE